VSAFGPEFRLWRPAQPAPSPCAAINAAARQARGRYLAIMIDGAHLLTPRVLAEARLALRAEPRSVVALRHWFIGGDQRWLASVGYSRDQEDILFARINWPVDGYSLFRIGAPIGESPNSWFDALSESNCLFLPASVYAEIGGMDEGFDEPGGGFVNLDLLRRATDACEGRVTCLVGEASFHQYHGGTTTNVPDAQKDALVEGYARNYRQRRGGAFEPLASPDIRLAGSIRSKHAVGLRQRPLFSAPLGVTDHVRPGAPSLHFDSGAAMNLQSAYAELGLHQATRWMGRPVGLAPTDLAAIQEIMHDIRPIYIVTTSQDAGLIAFIDSLCKLLDLDGSQIIRVASHRDVEFGPRRTQWVIGDPFAEDTLARVEGVIGAAEEVLVLFSPPEETGVPLTALQRYARLVSYGSYLIYLGSVFGQPWLGYSTHWHRRAIHSLAESGDRYAVDRSWERHLVTTCPWGYIRRVGGLVEISEDGEALDDLSVFEESYSS
jgi:cephalosporin hydroxylase